MFAISFIKIISALLAIVGGMMIMPLCVGLAIGENSVILSFLIPMLASFMLLAIVFIPTRKLKISINTRQTYLIVAGSWIFMSLFGAVPLFATGAFPSVTDAVFESVSGFTTTGSTVCGHLETLPRSINLWRCITHWIGGMGIVTLTVALLPLLGVGGFQLIKAETTGPEKGKITARITTTAKYLWIIYAGFTLIEAVLLRLAGMDWLDAFSHAFSTLGTGGFSPKDSSIGWYNSAAIDTIITVFMFFAGINFSLFYYIIVRKFDDIRDNSEFKAYIALVIFAILAVTFSLGGIYNTFPQKLRYGAFHVVSLLSTTGFSTADFTLWSPAAQFFLFALFFVGGCSGSTSGGVKVVRWVILFKQISNETKRMLHPHGIFAIRLNNRVGRKDVVFNVTAFMTLYFFMVALTTLVGCIGQLDLFTAFTGALSMIGNVGPAAGILSPSGNFGALPVFVKWWYCFAMLAGRLELYTMIMFFLPYYWER
ncbi:MAG: TrkH family potassium uptake protein [Treponema sp.]|nr:TrkH family potassium uptake protein [Treponema sp.]